MVQSRKSRKQGEINIVETYKDIQDILEKNKVKSYKETSEGLIAIRKNGFWVYFRFVPSKNWYIATGTTLHFEYR
jgi:hypothetical protein